MKNSSLFTITLFLCSPIFLAAQTNYYATTPNATGPGEFNTSVGILAGNSGNMYLNNTFLGFRAGNANQTSGNTFIGSRSGENNTFAYDNTFIGMNTGNNNVGLNNVLIGAYAGNNNRIGNGNVIVGTRAGQAADGNGNTFLGYQAGISNIGGSKNLLLGTRADVGGYGIENATAIGANAKVAVSDAIVLGDASNTNMKVGIGTDSPQFPLDVRGIINIRGNGTLKFSHLSNPNIQNNSTDQFLTVDANGETVLAKVAEVDDLKAQVVELTRQLLELRKRLDQVERGEKAIAGKE